MGLAMWNFLTKADGTLLKVHVLITLNPFPETDSLSL